MRAEILLACLTQKHLSTVSKDIFLIDRNDAQAELAVYKLFKWAIPGLFFFIFVFSIQFKNCI